MAMRARQGSSYPRPTQPGDAKENPQRRKLPIEAIVLGAMRGLGLVYIGRRRT